MSHTNKVSKSKIIHAMTGLTNLFVNLISTTYTKTRYKNKENLIWHSSEYRRQKETESLEKGRIDTQMQIEMHQSESAAEFGIVY